MIEKATVFIKIYWNEIGQPDEIWKLIVSNELKCFWPSSLVRNGTILVLVTFVTGGLLVGHLLGLSAENRSVLAPDSAARHPAIALALASANLPDHKLLPTAILLYQVINAIEILPYQKWIAKRIEPAGKPT